MIQALNVLRGNKGGADVESHLSRIILKTLQAEIAHECDLLNAPPKGDPRKQDPVNPSKEEKIFAVDDATEISEGLGDEFDYDSQEEEEESGALRIPGARQGVKESDLDQDMAVENPESEAKVEAPKIENQAEADEHAEETFQQMIMGEAMDGEDFIDQRIAKRRYKNPKARRAKVEGFTGDNHAELGLGGGGVTI